MPWSWGCSPRWPCTGRSRTHPHGYWIAVTLVVALRPLPENGPTPCAADLGTLLGALIAFLVIVALPTLLAALVAAVCLYWLAVYSMSGNYFMQTAPHPDVAGSSPHSATRKGPGLHRRAGLLHHRRVAVGVVAAIVLDRWDKVAADRVA